MVPHFVHLLMMAFCYTPFDKWDTKCDTDVISESFFFFEKIDIGCNFSWKLKKNTGLVIIFLLFCKCLFGRKAEEHFASRHRGTWMTLIALWHCYMTGAQMVIKVKILVPHLYQQCLPRLALKEAELSTPVGMRCTFNGLGPASEDPTTPHLEVRLRWVSWISLQASTSKTPHPDSSVAQHHVRCQHQDGKAHQARSQCHGFVCKKIRE